MLKNKNKSDDSANPSCSNNNSGDQNKPKNKGLLGRFKSLFIKAKNNSEGLREVLEEYMVELEDDTQNNPSSIASHESALISNVLKLRDRTVIDVMIPRVDIASIDVNSTFEEMMALLSEKQFSRIPVYRDTLDNILGTVHIKDILSNVASKTDLNLKSLIRPVPIVSPSLPVLDLLLKMQSDRKHMVMVVDEYGGIDGLATIGDVIEAIVGEFDDEFDTETAPQMTMRNDGSLIADARIYIEDFEDRFGSILSEEEREEVDTLGGLVFFTANRIPARGEIIKHETGMVFEIVEADQRRINRLRIQNIPSSEDI